MPNHAQLNVDDDFGPMLLNITVTCKCGTDVSLSRTWYQNSDWSHRGHCADCDTWIHIGLDDVLGQYSDKPK